MSASGLMTAVLEYTADRLVNDAGADAPDRILSYHGTVLPADCCTEAGTLACMWADGRAGDKMPTSSATAQVDPCAKLHQVTLDVRWLRCTPKVEVSPQGVTVNASFDTLWNDYALTMVDVADTVARQFTELQCLATKPHRPDDPELDEYELAVLANLARIGSFRLLDWSPIVPSGLCAGVHWRLAVAATPQATS